MMGEGGEAVQLCLTEGERSEPSDSTDHNTRASKRSNPCRSSTSPRPSLWMVVYCRFALLTRS